MIEMRVTPPLEWMSNQGWMRRVWAVVSAKFTPQTGTESYRAKPNPICELSRVNGKLVLMGRNQTMKMLIQGDGSPVGVRNA